MDAWYRSVKERHPAEVPCSKGCRDCCIGLFDVSLADLLAKFGFVVTSSTPFSELLTVTLPRVGALLPFLMLVLILVFRPRGLMGTRDT